MSDFATLMLEMSLEKAGSLSERERKKKKRKENQKETKSGGGREGKGRILSRGKAAWRRRSH